MNLNKLFIAGLIASLTTSAQAATVSYSGNLFSNVSEATFGTTELPKFNSAFGVLTGVTLTSVVTGTATLNVFNSTKTTKPFTKGSASFDFTLIAPQVRVNSNAGVSGLSGTVLPSNTNTYSGSITSANGNYQVALSDLMLYLGDGTTTFTATGDLSDGIYGGRAASGVFFSGSSLISADAVVTYTYAVPEPLVVLGALTAVGFGVAFKLRAKK